MSLTRLPDGAAAVTGVLCRAGAGVARVRLLGAADDHCWFGVYFTFSDLES